MLDRTGNFKAVKRLLGHADASTTLDACVDWDVDQLAASMADVVEDYDS